MQFQRCTVMAASRTLIAKFPLLTSEVKTDIQSGWTSGACVSAKEHHMHEQAPHKMADQGEIYDSCLNNMHHTCTFLPEKNPNWRRKKRTEMDPLSLSITRELFSPVSPK